MQSQSPARTASESHLVDDSASLSAFDIPGRRKIQDGKDANKQPKCSKQRCTTGEKPSGDRTSLRVWETSQTTCKPVILTQEESRKTHLAICPQAMAEGKTQSRDSSAKGMKVVGCTNKDSLPAGDNARPDTKPGLVNAFAQVSQSLFNNKHSQEVQVGHSLLAVQSQVDGSLGGANSIASMGFDSWDFNLEDVERQIEVHSTQMDDAATSQAPQPDFPLSPLLDLQASPQGGKQSEEAVDLGPRCPGRISQPASATARRLQIAVPATASLAKISASSQRDTVEKWCGKTLQSSRKGDHHSIASMYSTENSSKDETRSGVVSDDDDSPVSSLPEIICVEPMQTPSRAETTSKGPLGFNLRAASSTNTPRAAGCTTSSASRPCAKPLLETKKSQHLRLDGKGHAGIMCMHAKVDSRCLYVQPMKHATDGATPRRKRKLLPKKCAPFAESPESPTLEEAVISFVAGDPRGREPRSSRQQSEVALSVDEELSGHTTSKKLFLPTPVSSLPSHQPSCQIETSGQEAGSSVSLPPQDSQTVVAQIEVSLATPLSAVCFACHDAQTLVGICK